MVVITMTQENLNWYGSYYNDTRKPKLLW